MNLRDCSRQPEVLALLAHGHWPHACPPELREHLAGCRSCADLLLVTHTFQKSRATAAAQAQLPAPGAIWWRAQLRRRSAAVERIGKPIFGAYLFATAIAVLVAAIAVVSLGSHWLRWLQQSSAADLHTQAFNAGSGISGWGIPVLIPVLATVALLGAVVAYFAAERQ